MTLMCFHYFCIWGKKSQRPEHFCRVLCHKWWFCANLKRAKESCLLINEKSMLLCGFRWRRHACFPYFSVSSDVSQTETNREKSQKLSRWKWSAVRFILDLNLQEAIHIQKEKLIWFSRCEKETKTKLHRKIEIESGIPHNPSGFSILKEIYLLFQVQGGAPESNICSTVRPQSARRRAATDARVEVSVSRNLWLRYRTWFHLLKAAIVSLVSLRTQHVVWLLLFPRFINALAVVNTGGLLLQTRLDLFLFLSFSSVFVQKCYHNS